MTQVLARIPAYSNQSMLDYCDTLLSILTQSHQTKVGRGKKVEMVKVFKHKQDQDVIDKLIRSKEHYNKLNQMKNKGGVTFRDYQVDIIEKGTQILEKHGFLYLAMEVRTGKTLTSLGIADEVKSWKVLFVTKKKAISTIEADYKLLNPAYFLTVINYESLHLVMDNEEWDLVICDEAHSMGAFPKPSGRALLVAQVIRKYRPKVILLSGTPTPESYSQMYHQVYAIPNNPFSEFANFYRFCDKYVSIKQKKINSMFIKDYSHGLDDIIKAMEPYTINYTQVEAGFKSEVKEEVLYVPMKDSTYSMIKRLKRDLVIEGKEETILADTAVKLMMKVHQLCSGTIKFESGNSMVLDTTKAEFIKQKFQGSKVGIFYKFKEEYNALKQVNKTYTKQYQTRKITRLITLKKTFMEQTAVQWFATRVTYLKISPKEMHDFLDWYEEAMQMEKEQMLNFYMWMRMNERAEEYFHYSDEDMFAEYLKQEKDA